MLPSAGRPRVIDAATEYALRWSPEGIVQGIKISPQSTCKWLMGKKWSGFGFDSHHPLQMQTTTATSSEGAVLVRGAARGRAARGRGSVFLHHPGRAVRFVLHRLTRCLRQDPDLLLRQVVHALQ
jgi:hypothetical protein